MMMKENGATQTVAAEPVRCTCDQCGHEFEAVPAPRHKVLCGDSLDAATLERLVDGETPDMVWADPPYGYKVVKADGRVGTTSRVGFKGRVGYAGVGKAGVYAPIVGDDTTDTAKGAFALCYERWPDAVHVWWGGNFYASGLPDSQHWLVWDKMTDGNTFADGELAWTNQDGALRFFRHQWSGMLRASERGEKRVHPTQKPCALAAWAFDHYGAVGDLVLDPFLGSGMSVIGAEQSGRRVYGLELSAEYCNIVLSRWETAVGEEAYLIERLAEDDEESAAPVDDAAPGGAA